MVQQGTKVHTLEERGTQLYPTHPSATRALLRNVGLPHRLWEPACGTGDMVAVLREAGHEVVASDLFDYGERMCPDAKAGVDFLAVRERPHRTDVIVTNPPFSQWNCFVRHGLRLCERVYVLGRLAALEGTGRSDIIDRYLHTVLPFKERIPMMHRDGWDGPRATSTTPYAWYLFDRGKDPNECTYLRRISLREPTT